MNVGLATTALANMSMPSDIGVALLSNSLEATQTMGEGMVQMLDASAMELSVNPNVGSMLDIRV
jgi:hypothetical protein